MKKHVKIFKLKACTQCKEGFIPRSSLNRFCSHTCKTRFEVEARSNKPKTKNCKVCNETFTPYTSLDKFCSIDCRIKNQKSKRSFNWKSNENIEGKKNPCYRTGNYIKGKKNPLAWKEREFIRNRKQIVSEMVEQHGFRFCQRCEINQSPVWETHHIVYRSEAPKHENLHNKRNLIHVCTKCHNWFHSKKDRREYLIEERKLWELFPDHIKNRGMGGSKLLDTPDNLQALCRPCHLRKTNNK